MVAGNSSVFDCQLKVFLSTALIMAHFAFMGLSAALSFTSS